jgi:hypothetical protein
MLRCIANCEEDQRSFVQRSGIGGFIAADAVPAWQVLQLRAAISRSTAITTNGADAGMWQRVEQSNTKLLTLPSLRPPEEACSKYYGYC